MPQTGVDAALADLAKSPEQLRAENAPPTTPADSSSIPAPARFGITAAVRGLGNLAGFVTDPLAQLRHLVSPDLERIEESGKFRPGEEAGNAVFNATGIPEYQPTSTAGRIGLATAEGAIGGGPFGVGPAVLSGIGGALGQGAYEATGSERLATAASLLPAAVAPPMRAGVNYGVGLARDVLPMRQPALEAAVGSTLRNAATDPDALAEALRERLQLPNPNGGGAGELVPGSRPTTFQLSGDQGVGQLQSSLPSSPFDARATQQNVARVGALQNLAPADANAGAVRDLLQQRLDQIDRNGDAAVQAAQQRAQQAFDVTGGQINPEDAGAAMRGQLEQAKASTKAAELQLWQAIDPDGSLTIDATPVRDAANQIASEIPRTAAQPSGEEAAVLSFARLGGTALPFTDFSALRGRLLQAIRDERANGQTPALRRMQMLRQAMDDTIAATATKAAQGDQALYGRLAQQTGDFLGGTDTGASAARVGQYGGSRPANSADFGPQAPAGVSGAAGDPGGGFGGVARSQGLPEAPRPFDLTESVPNGGSSVVAAPLPRPAPSATFDPEAAARYRAAADATRARAQTFNNPMVGPALQERGGAYRVADSRLPERFISSPEGVQAFLNAGGDRATLRDALVADLRQSATNPDGSLSPTKYASWQLRRAAALRAMPDVQMALGDAARAQEAVDAVAATARAERLGFERGAARHFLGAEPLQAVQSALGGKNPVGDLRDLVRLAAGDPDAAAGLQRAVADYIVARTVRAPLGEAETGTMNANAFAEMMRRDQVLRQVFSAEQMGPLNNIAADLQRSGQSSSGGAVAGNAGAGGSKLSLLSQYLGHGIAGVAGYLLGGVHGAIEGSGGYAMAKSAIDAMRRAGIERREKLLTEALLNPELAQTLLMKATPGNRPFIAARLAKQLGTIAATMANQPQQEQRPRPAPAVPMPNIAMRRSASAQAPAIPPIVWGSLAPGGAMRQRAVP